MADVSTDIDAVARLRPVWDKIDALLGGTKTMRAAGSTYLPKWPKESIDGYNARLNSTFLFNVIGRTLGNLAGKPFKEPLTAIDTPDEVLAWFEDFDLTGRKLDVFAQEVFSAGLRYGLTHVLTDMPVSSGIRTVADEKAQGLRPYAVHIKAPAVVGWRTARINGAETLTQLRFHECVSEADGAFGTKEVDQIRVLTRPDTGSVTWETWRKDEAGVWQQFLTGVTSRPDIPLTTFYTMREDFMVASAPLEDLADLNIEHWQSSSDQRTILHVARVPMLTLIGMQDTDQVVVGAKEALILPEGAKAEWLEHKGAAIGAGRQDLLDLEERMRLMGAELLVKGPGKLSATQAALDTSQQQSYLAALAGALEDFLDEVVESMAAWKGINVTKSHVSVFKDFGIADFDNAAETLLLSAANAGRISDETFFNELKRRGTINGDVTWEDEQARIADQPSGLPAGGMGAAGLLKIPNPEANVGATGQ